MDYPFTVVVWDYDAAPDAEDPYYIWKRVACRSQCEAIGVASHYCEELCCVGAAVFRNNAVVFALGLTDSTAI